MSCIFCDIANHQAKASILFEDDSVIAFEDIAPQAPFHCLVIPKKHISTVNDVEIQDAAIFSHLMVAAQHIAKEHGFANDGYRLVLNCNEHGCQTVYHVHLHVLAQRQLSWPPG